MWRHGSWTFALAAALAAGGLATGCGEGTGESPRRVGPVRQAWGVPLRSAPPLPVKAEDGSPAVPDAETQAPKPRPAPAKPEAAAPADLPKVAVGAGKVLEVESFKLSGGAAVKPLAGASGEKAVLFTDTKGRVEVRLALEAGAYAFVVFVQARDAKHDAFFVSLGEKEHRLFPKEFGKVMATRPLVARLPAAAEMVFAIHAAETDVYIDRVVVKKGHFKQAPAKAPVY